jgi:ATP-dependent Clp protease ATP-binding subunit ClpC
MADRFDKFTERARRVLTHAQEEAQRLNHNYIGTEHLLLSLTRQDDSVAARVLSNLGIELRHIRTAVEVIIGRGEPSPHGEFGLTPGAKKVIELSIGEARRLNHNHIGTEHLLFGLFMEDEGVAHGVLESLGVDLEGVRAETASVLSGASPPDQRVAVEAGIARAMPAIDDAISAI